MAGGAEKGLDMAENEEQSIFLLIETPQIEKLGKQPFSLEACGYITIEVQKEVKDYVESR